MVLHFILTDEECEWVVRIIDEDRKGWKEREEDGNGIGTVEKGTIELHSTTGEKKSIILILISKNQNFRFVFSAVGGNQKKAFSAYL